MHTLVLYASFDFGFELDLWPLLGNKDPERSDSRAGKRGRLLAALKAAAPECDWRNGAGDEPDGQQELTGYGGQFYRAPSKRPPFLCSAGIAAHDETLEEIRKAAEAHQFALESLQFVFQDYGIGVVELTLALTPKAAAQSPRAMADSVCELCDALPRLTAGAGARLAGILADAAGNVGIAFADDSTSLVHRGGRGKRPEKVTLSYLWTHSLFVVDNRDSSLGAVGTQSWRDDMACKGVFPKGDHFFSDALSFRCATPAAFVTRELEAAAIFGWGNSLVILAPGGSSARYDSLIPIHYVMRILQSLSAGLFILNSALLNEILVVGNEKRQRNRAEYHRRREAIDNLHFLADLYLSLMDEQRYNQSAHERVLWDAAVGAWDVQSQIASTTRNIDLLYKLYSSRKAHIDAHVSKKLTAGLAVITVASAAGVGFSIIRTVLAGPNWEQLMYQILVLVVLLGFSWFLFTPPRN